MVPNLSTSFLSYKICIRIPLCAVDGGSVHLMHAICIFAIMHISHYCAHAATSGTGAIAKSWKLPINRF